MNYDVVIVGSGFGGAVAACRLAHAGRSVLVLERGRRWAPQDYPNLADRINRAWLAQFKQYAAARHKPGTVQNLIASDRLFEQDPLAAYAESWALTFYLTETQSRSYADYLKKTADRPAFAPYTGPQRMSDFAATFGDDWQMLDARVRRFIDELR